MEGNPPGRLLALTLKQQENTRSISAIECPVKMYSRAPVMGMEKVVSKLIGPDQTGFVNGQLAADKIRIVLHVRSETKRKSHPLTASYS